MVDTSLFGPQVCLAVYVATQAADVISKVVGVYFVLSAFVVIQYEHVVADMFTIPMCVNSV